MTRRYRVQEAGRVWYTDSHDEAREAALGDAEVTPSPFFYPEDAVRSACKAWAALGGMVALSEGVSWIDRHAPECMKTILFLVAVGSTPLWIWLMVGDRRPR